MELIQELVGSRVFIDTSPFIYFIEGHNQYASVMKEIFQRVDSGHIEAITSTITLLEVLVQPFRKGDEALADRYKEILLNSRGLTTFEITHDVSQRAASLRARFSLRTPDALQISVARTHRAAKFLTNDRHLKRVSQIVNVAVLDDFL